MDLNMLITIGVLIISGINLIMLLRLKTVKLESELDLMRLEKQLTEIINGKYVRKEHADQLLRELDERINRLDHEINDKHGGVRKRIHDMADRLNILWIKSEL